jgi:hypothetical protein
MEQTPSRRFAPAGAQVMRSRYVDRNEIARYYYFMK